MSEDPNSSSPADYQRQAKNAWYIGGSLMVFSAISLGVWSLTGSTRWHIVTCLVFAFVQIMIQVLIMMHLKNERGIIFKFLVFTLFFVMALFVLTGLAKSSPLHDATFSSSK